MATPSAPYDMPSNMSSMGDFMVYVNDITGGYYALLLLTLWWYIIFTYSKVYETKKAFAVASWITSLTAGFLFALGLIQGYVLTVTAGMAALGLFMLYLGEDT